MNINEIIIDIEKRKIETIQFSVNKIINWPKNLFIPYHMHHVWTFCETDGLGVGPMDAQILNRVAPAKH